MSQLTNCQYLFGPYASQSINAQYFNEQEANHYLEILMQVHSYFLAKKAAYFLLDPVINNNQCHLYSLTAVELLKGYAEKSEAERRSKTSENRFLHLLALLSSTALAESDPYAKVVQKHYQVAFGDPIQDEKKFITYVKDPQGFRLKAARSALSDFFRERLQRVLSLGESERERELYQLSLENDVSSLEKFYTLPKLAGVDHFMRQGALHALTMVFKVKIIAERQSCTLTLSPLYALLEKFTAFPKAVLNLVREYAIEDSESVVVLEALSTASASPQSLYAMMSAASRCPSSFYRKPRARNRHEAKEACSFCTRNDDLRSSKEERISTLLLDPNELLYALGAEFLQKEQPKFLHHFKNEQKYPELHALYHRVKEKGRALGLTICSPTAFHLVHIYPDNAGHAFQEEARANYSPEDFLKLRGLL